METTDVEYLGFGPRVVASLIDNLLVLVIFAPLSYFLTGKADSNFATAASVIAVLAYWYYKQSSPGKMIFDSKIVDAKTGGKMTTGQIVGRYFAYVISAIPLGLGFIWIAFDKKKQGWHDKLAGTVVIRTNRHAA
jgi:uncharacterized RDD family membrane protein YckC